MSLRRRPARSLALVALAIVVAQPLVAAWAVPKAPQEGATGDPGSLGAPLALALPEGGHVVLPPLPAGASVDLVEHRGEVLSRLDFGPAHREALDLLDPALLDVLGLVRGGHLAPEGTLPVVARAQGLEALAGVAGALRGARVLEHLPFALGRVALGDLPVLARAQGLEQAWLDARLELHLADSVRLVRAHEVHAQRTASGDAVNGTGVRVAIVDTGVDYTHPDLGGCLGPGCKVAKGFDFVHMDTDPMDDYGHGTHVAAIAAGLQGVAPGATVHAYKACDQHGGCLVSWVLNALDRAVGDDADIVSLSLGGAGDSSSPLSLAADDASHAGVVVVSSAGNRGAYETIGQPAASVQGIAVGATDKEDRLAYFSSRGPVVDEGWRLGEMKPDLVAPGVDIVAAVPLGSCTLCDPSGYRSLSGTSMAAPHVSGAAALLLQAHPTWSNRDVKAALTGRAEGLGLDSRSEGAGRLDAFEAYRAELAVTPGNPFLGLAVAGDPGFHATLPVVVKNLGSRPLQADVTTLTAGFEAALRARLPLPHASVGFPLPTRLATPIVHAPEATPVLLAPGRSVTFDLTVEADHALLADGWWEGRLLARGDLPDVPATPTADLTAPTTTAVGKFTFLKVGLFFVAAPFPERIALVPQVGGSLYVAGPEPGQYLRADPGRYETWAEFSGDRWVFQHDLVHDGNTTLAFDPAKAVHQVLLDPVLQDGTVLPGSTPYCGPSVSAQPCIVAGNKRLALEDSDFSLSRFHLGWNVRSVLVSEATDRWVYGQVVEYRDGLTSYKEMNAVRLGRNASVNLTLAPSAFVGHTGRYAFPHPHDEGVRVEFCTNGGWGFGYSLLVEEGQRETWLVGDTTLPRVRHVYSHQEGTSYPATCDLLDQWLRAGQRDGALDCIDPDGCRQTAETFYRRSTPQGVQVVDRSWTLLDPPLDLRHGLRDGDLVLADGAPSFGGRATGHPWYFQAFAAPDWSTWFTPGGLAFQADHQRSSGRTTYALRHDGQTLQEGNLGLRSSVGRHFYPALGIVEFEAHLQGTLLEDGEGNASYLFRYDLARTDALHPWVRWVRVTDAAGLGTHFPDGAPLALHAKVDHAGAPLVGIDVVVRKAGQQHTVGGAMPGPDGLVHVDLPAWGPGGYEVEVTARTTDGDLVRLVQEPAYTVGP